MSIRSALSVLFAKNAGGAPVPSTGYLPMLGSTPSAASVLVSQGTAISVSPVHACVTIRAQDVARCTPRLFHVNPKSGVRDSVPIREHDVVELFRRPNRQQTWFEFCEQMMVGYLMRGNAYAALKGVTKRGQVDELIPINPDAVLVMEAVDGGVFYNVNRIGLWQIAMLREFGSTIAEENIFHLRDMSFNALVGASTIHVARDGIGIAMGLEQQAANWLANAGRPSVVLQSKKSLTETAAKRLKAAWNEFASGLKNTGNAVVLEDGLEAKPLLLTSTDIAFIEQRKFSTEDLCRFWKVPPFKLGATELRGIDIEEINNAYVSNTIMPDLHRIEQKFEQVFDLDRQNIAVSFDERALLRSSDKVRYQNYRLGLGGASFLKVDEVRAAEQLDPVPGGDVIYQPSNLAAAGSDRAGVAPDGAGRPADGHLPTPAPATAKPNTDDVAEAAAAPSVMKFTLPAVDQKSLDRAAA